MGEVGTTNHATRYAITPQTIAPGTIDRTTHATRTIVGSTAKYSASPPQTTAIRRSVRERRSCGRVTGAAASTASAPGIRIQAATYATTPSTTAPGQIDSTIHASRTNVTSISK